MIGSGLPFGRALLGLALAVSRAPAPAGPPADPLPVRLEVDQGGYLVGQPIGARLRVIAAADLPQVRPPEVADLEIIPIGSDVRPLTSQAIGTMVRERNAFRFDYLLIPRRAGRLVVPPFEVTVDGRSGSSGSVPLEVRPPPAVGRPPGYLGGVGDLEVTVQVVPGAVRLGGTFRLILRLEGPGAYGSVARPALPDLTRSGLDLRAGPAGGSWSAWPPVRIWEYSVRPGRPGRGRLPPIVVATFDPASKSYRTTATAGVDLRVDAPPPLTVDALESAPVGRPGRSIAGLLTLGALAVLAVGGGVAGSVRASRRWAASPRAFAGGAGGKLAVADGARVAEEATELLIGYLGRAVGRPAGAITPAEAAEQVERATGRRDLADLARDLVERCDRSRFAGNDDPGSPAAIRGIGSALFAGLARGPARRVDP